MLNAILLLSLPLSVLPSHYISLPLLAFLSFLYFPTSALLPAILLGFLSSLVLHYTLSNFVLGIWFSWSLFSYPRLYHIPGIPIYATMPNENMKLIHSKLEKNFIFPIKDNRLVALSKEDKLAGRFISVESMKLEENSLSLVFLQGLDFPVMLTKQIFTNKDDSKLVQYLVSNDLTLSSSSFSTIYKKRWKVEEFHKSLKSNLGFSKSPTHTKTSQTNHFFASIFAFFKLELLHFKAKLNHFSLKSKLYFSALKASLAQLKKLSAQLAA